MPAAATTSRDIYDAGSSTCTKMAPLSSHLDGATQKEGQNKNHSSSRLRRKSSAMKPRASGNFDSSIQDLRTYQENGWDGMYCMATGTQLYRQDQLMQLEGQPILNLPRTFRRKKITTKLGRHPNKSARMSRRRFHIIIQKLADVAFVLCVLDCTVLPVVTLILPVISSGGTLFNDPVASSITTDAGDNVDRGSYLHQLMLLPVQTLRQLMTNPSLGHWVAVWFVLPVGSLSSILNYCILHRQIWLVSMAAFGLVCVGLANIFGPHDHSDNFPHHRELPLVDNISDASSISLLIQLAIINHHRLLNVVGCASLLSSNYISRRFYGCVDHNLYIDHNRFPLSYQKKSKGSDEINIMESAIDATTVDSDGIMLWNMIHKGSLTKRRSCYCQQV